MGGTLTWLAEGLSPGGRGWVAADAEGPVCLCVIWANVSQL